MTLEKHSRTPWEYNKDENGSAVAHRIGAEICRAGMWIGTWFDHAWDGKCPNSDFILRAVNNHDELVSMLETILDLWHERQCVGPMTYHDARALIARAKGVSDVS